MEETRPVAETTPPITTLVQEKHQEPIKESVIAVPPTIPPVLPVSVPMTKILTPEVDASTAPGVVPIVEVAAAVATLSAQPAAIALSNAPVSAPVVVTPAISSCPSEKSDQKGIVSIQSAKEQALNHHHHSITTNSHNKSSAEKNEKTEKVTHVMVETKQNEHEQFLHLLLSNKHDYNLEVLKDPTDWNKFLTADIALWMLVSSKDTTCLQFVYEMSKLIPRQIEINELSQVRYGLCLDQNVPPLRHWNSQFADIVVLPTALIFLEGKRFYAAARAPSKESNINILDVKEIHSQLQQALTVLTRKRLQQIASPVAPPPQAEEKVVKFNTLENKTHIYSESSVNKPTKHESKAIVASQVKKLKKGKTPRSQQSTEPSSQSLQELWERQEVLQQKKQQQEDRDLTPGIKKQRRPRRSGNTTPNNNNTPNCIIS